MHKASITKFVLSAISLCQHTSLLVEAVPENSAGQGPRSANARWRPEHDGNTCANQDDDQGLSDAALPARCTRQRASLLQLGHNMHKPQLPFDGGEDPKQSQGHPSPRLPASAAAEIAKEKSKSVRNNTKGSTLQKRDSKKEDSEVGYPRGSVAAMMLVTEIVYKGARSGVHHAPSLTFTMVCVFVGAALMLLTIIRMMNDKDDSRMSNAVRRSRPAAAPQIIRHRAPAPSHTVSPRTSYITSSKAPSMRQLGPSYTMQSMTMAATPDFTTNISPRQVEPIIRATSPKAVLRTPQQPREVLPLIASRHLCPGLVVPAGNECILAVPTLRHVGVPPRDRAAFNIQDLDGKSVIQAEVMAPKWVNIQASGIEQRPMLVLRAGLVPGSGGRAPAPLLAYCKAGQEAGERRNVYIYDARDELFAHISKDRNYRTRYVLTSGRIGLQLIFEGDFASRRVQVTNEQQQLLSETEACRMSFDPSGSYYKLRVVADVDVGLMLCALIAIDHMELP
mmetsp:Transcript_154475/g.280653  ORF Transcript_154475/g.280653 Transcript_154475/m.280653 type:complete len:507 (+) Transcript_154475:197-1717(+)